MNNPLDRLRHYVTGAIERGEAQPITEDNGMTAILDNDARRAADANYKHAGGVPAAPTPRDISRAVAKQVVSRCEAQNFKGKRRDDLALEMFAGACMMAMAQYPETHPIARHFLTVTVLRVISQGYAGILELAKEARQ